MNLLKKLKQRNSALYASLFAVICVGTPHIVPVVAQFSQFQSQWAAIPHALMYALALEVGIVFFALRSKMVQTIIFAIIATSLYLGYYDNYIPWWTITPFMPIDISISLPVMIVLIAHETSKKRKKRNRIVSKQPPIGTDMLQFTSKRPPEQSNRPYFDEADNTFKMNGKEDDVHIEIGEEGTVAEVLERQKNPKPLTEEIKQEILKLIDAGNTYRDIAVKTHTSISTISRVKNEQDEQNETVNETGQES